MAELLEAAAAAGRAADRPADFNRFCKARVNVAYRVTDFRTRGCGQHGISKLIVHSLILYDVPANERRFLLAAPLWNHNFHYHNLLLSMVPSPCRAALDIGCGDGTLVGKLARRAERVIGIDTSSAMIQRASTNLKARHAPRDANTTLIHGDLLTHSFADQRFDFITCVATIHHMDFRAALERMKSLLQPNGTIAILGMARASTPRDFLYNAAGFISTRMMRLGRGYFDPGAPIANPRMTYASVERAAAELLPGATFRRLVLFRYSLVWSARAKQVESKTISE